MRHTIELTLAAAFIGLVAAACNEGTAPATDQAQVLAARIPRFHLGDTAKVIAAVGNTTGSGFTPASFVFLHVRHASTLNTNWRRVPMLDNGDGTYQRTWIAQQTGIDRFIVDALDSATLLLGTADNYRTKEVGIPYRIE